MNFRQYLVLIIFSTCCTLTLRAQTDVWPVQVSGSMLPPHSLNLKVYSLDRAGDLSFSALLRDPVQASLYVRPVISIEQNGTVIYQTDPNYAGNPVLLSQFEQMVLNGSALSEYLSNVALIGATANSTGSIDVPEGFNQICLQLYGVERNVPVSNKFCISGNFRLSQPPQIVKPAFNEKIKMPPVQNFIFSWQPMHIGSPNNPGPVEYTFELVELPMGVMNANDAFASVLKVYTTKTMATSLIYTQGEPILEANKYYAWRITATSVIYPTSKLFQNDGKGEVSVFILYDGDVPEGDVNPFDKASPRGCSVYETAYGPVSKADNAPVIAAPNQNVKVGYFDMKITEAYGSQLQGYSGKGLIEYPMLRSVLEVEFKNIKVNKDGRVYEAERISALIDPALKLNVQNINKEKAEQVITVNYMDKLNALLQKPNSDVAKLPEGGTVLNTLPLSLQFDKQQPPVTVTGIELTPTNAYLNFISQTDDGGIYAATLIPSTPYGVKSNSYLTPLHVNGIERASVKLIESIESGNVVSDKSKMGCNCKGYESLNSQLQLSVSTSIMKRTDNEAPVTFESIKKMDNYDNVITEVKNIPEFKVNRLDGFSFKAKSGELDLSTSGNGFSPNVNEYTSKQSAGWKGLRLKDVQVTIPEKYNIINPKSKLVLDKGEIYIDENELAYGHFSKSDVLSLSKGKMGPWNYSIDTMKVTMDARQIGKFRLSGAIKTPFFDDRFPYQAVVAEAGQKQIKLDAVIPATKLGMGIWHGTFITQSPSTVDARLVELGDEKQLTPKCNFTGDMTAKFTDKEFRDAILNTNKGETLDALKNALKIDNFAFDLSGLRLNGLSNDPMKEREKRFKIEGFDLKNVHLTVGGATNQLSAAALEYKVEEKRKRLGLKTIIIKESSKVELTIWAESVNGNFRFEGIEVNSIDLKCNCGVASVIPSKESWDRIIDQFYDRQYMLSSVEFSKSGVQSVNPGIAFNVGKELALEEIKRNAIAWFPALNNNNAINIPFLDRNLSIENAGGSYKGKYRNGVAIGDNTVWTKDLFNSLTNEASGDLTLPLVITEELWSKFGFKGDYTLPENYKLFITEFKTSGSDKLSNATVKVGLVGDLQVDGKEVFIYFGGKEDIGIGPNKVAFKDVFLHLAKDTKLDESVTYLSSGNGDKTSESGSYVGLDCTAGIHNFNLQGSFTVRQNTLISTGEKKGSTPQPTTFGFKLIENQIADNDELLSAFVAPLKTIFKENKDWKPWSFSTEDAQHISFSGGNSFEAWLDYSSNKSISVADEDKNNLDDFTRIRLFSEYFKGIIFNKMEFGIPMLELRGAEKNSKPETFKDVITMAFYEIESNAFFSSYQGINKIPKENKARLGGWSYHLDTISFNFEYNTLNEDKLLLKGATRIPLFKEAPEKNKEKWLETYSDAWVPYSLNVEYNNKEDYPEISGTVDGVEDHLFESKHIDGLGLKLNSESSVAFNYDSDQNRLIARANLNGRSVYHIEKLDANIPLLAFQDFNVNYNASGLCKSNSTDGIESIDFGTWGIMEFSELEKLAMSKAGNAIANTQTAKNVAAKVKENKFVKSLGGKTDGLSKLASFEINIHQPTFQCTGNEWKFFIGLDLSIMRDKQHLTEKQQTAYDKYNPEEAAARKKTEAESQLKPLENEYKEAQKHIKAIADERTKLLKEKNDLQYVIKAKSAKKDDRSSEIAGHKTRIAEYEKQIAELDKKYKTASATVKEKYKPFKEQNSKVKEASNEVDKLTKAAVVKQDKYNKSGIKDRLKEDRQTFKDKLAEAKETKTGAFSASGDIEVTFDDNGFKDVALTCLALGGEFGPIKFKGGINLFRDETKKETFDTSAVQSAWGNGFLGMIQLSMLENEFATKFQTGVKFDQKPGTSTVEDYRYWFADLSFNSATGIPLGETSFTLTGIGGGFYYNMARVIDGVKPTKKTPPAANNDHCKAEGMEAGKSLSGFTYEVRRGSLGGYLSVEISHVAHISLEGIVSVQVKIADDGLKFENLGLNLNGYLLYEDYSKRKTESTAIVKGEVNINFEEKFKVIGGIDFRFGKKAGPLEIAAPIDRNSNPDSWNSIKFCFSKDLNYVHAGSWGLPPNPFYTVPGPESTLKFLSAGITAPLFGKRELGVYFQAGNKIDGFPSIKYLLPNYDGKFKENPSLNNSLSGSGAMAGFRFHAEMEGDFFVGGWKASADFGANIGILGVASESMCNGQKQSIGFGNGYYVKGNAYALLSANATVFTFNIFKGQASIICDFGFPNPSYLLGNLDIKYDVGFWPVNHKGEVSIKVDIGEQPCMPKTDPLTGIHIHHDMSPTEGAKLDHIISRGTDDLPDNYMGYNREQINIYFGAKVFKGKTNFDLDKILTVDNKMFYKCNISTFEIYEKNTKKLIFSHQFVLPRDNHYVSSREWSVPLPSSGLTLKEETDYEIKITYNWYERQGQSGSWHEYTNHSEKVTSTFRTNKVIINSEIITSDLVRDQSPKEKQSFWNQKDYSSFLQFDERLSRDQLAKIFPTDEAYIYYAFITENTTNGTQIIHKTPIVRFPLNDRQEDKHPYYKSLGRSRTEFFSKRDLFIATGYLKLQPGSFCTMHLVRATFIDKEMPFATAGGYDYLKYLSYYPDVENDQQKFIYTINFGVSNYPSVDDKIKDAEVTYGIGEHSIAHSIRSTSMTKDYLQYIVDEDLKKEKLLIPNTYWGISGRKEGIDANDFKLISDKVKLYKTNAVVFDSVMLGTYPPYSQAIASNHSLNSEQANRIFSSVRLLQPSALGVEVPEYYYKLFLTKPNVNRYEITQSEIDNKKLINKKPTAKEDFIFYSTERDYSNYDFMIEDGVASTNALQFYLTLKSLTKMLQGYMQWYKSEDIGKNQFNGGVVSKDLIHQKIEDEYDKHLPKEYKGKSDILYKAVIQGTEREIAIPLKKLYLNDLNLGTDKELLLKLKPKVPN